MSSHKYLLIWACSRGELADEKLLSAIERYDSESFRVVKKAKRERKLDSIEILIFNIVCRSSSSETE